MNRETFLQTFSLFKPENYDVAALKRVPNSAGPFRKAGVLVGLVDRPNGLHVVLTTRAKHLKHHPGQVSFPGGKYETFDQSIVETALRETHEEIGISRQKLLTIGTLPELPTISRFHVTPVVAFIENSYIPIIDKNEVDALFEVPLAFLLNPNNLKTHDLSINNQQHRIFALAYNGHLIWGVTAQIIQALQQQFR